MHFGESENEHFAIEKWKINFCPVIAMYFVVVPICCCFNWVQNITTGFEIYIVSKTLNDTLQLCVYIPAV